MLKKFDQFLTERLSSPKWFPTSDGFESMPESRKHFGKQVDYVAFCTGRTVRPKTECQQASRSRHCWRRAASLRIRRRGWYCQLAGAHFSRLSLNFQCRNFQDEVSFSAYLRAIDKFFLPGSSPSSDQAFCFLSKSSNRSQMQWQYNL